MVRGYVEKMVSTTAPTIDSWDPATTLDMKTEMQLITQNVVMSALFSSVPAREPARVILESVDTVLRAALLRVLLPKRALETLPTRGNRKIAAARGSVRAVGEMTTQPSRLRMIPELRTDAPDRYARSV